MHRVVAPPCGTRASRDDRRLAAACLVVIAIHWLAAMALLLIVAM